MANAALFIGWGTPVPGRERQAIRVFNDSLQYYSKLQQQGQIESFEPVLLEQHSDDLIPAHDIGYVCGQSPLAEKAWLTPC